MSGEKSSSCDCRARRRKNWGLRIGHSLICFERTPAQLIGERGQGFSLMLRLMNNARVAVGFEALGMCEAAHRMSKNYASERRSMGKTIDQHELVRIFSIEWKPIFVPFGRWP